MDTVKLYWHKYLWADTTSRLVTTNFFIWVAVRLLFLTDAGAAMVTAMVVPSSPGELLFRPWTLLTYMFVHYDFVHLLVNMVWLLPFGRIMLATGRDSDILWLYILGGLAGAIAFILGSICGLPAHSVMTGASCSVIAIVTAVAWNLPKFDLNLILFGRVKLWIVAVVALALLIFFAGSLDIAIAHTAGAIAGTALHKVRFPALSTLFRRRKSTPKADTPLSPAEHNRLDDLLAKVSTSGYGSLSAAERQQLFDLSRRSKI